MKKIVAMLLCLTMILSLTAAAGIAEEAQEARQQAMFRVDNYQPAELPMAVNVRIDCFDNGTAKMIVEVSAVSAELQGDQGTYEMGTDGQLMFHFEIAGDVVGTPDGENAAQISLPYKAVVTVEFMGTSMPLTIDTALTGIYYASADEYSAPTADTLTTEPAHVDPPAATTDLSSYPYYTGTYNPAFLYNTTDLDSYKTIPALHRGTVEKLEYDAPAYAVNAATGENYTVHKALNVYLPYGYDPAVQYDILYLMHGGGGNEDEWFASSYLTNPANQHTRNVIDHTIENGQCQPLIIVTPTFYSNVEGVEINMQDFTAYFGEELRNDIIPLIETRYSTYAQGDVSTENLIATRDHRSFAGLSMGSLTSLRSVMMKNLDIISWVGSYSGAFMEDFTPFKEAVSQFSDYTVHYWYNGEGVNDMAFEGHYAFYNTAMAEMSEMFRDAENACMVVLEDGEHTFPSWQTHLYHTLLTFFK